jgi:hypothetical protein
VSANGRRRGSANGPWLLIDATFRVEGIAGKGMSSRIPVLIRHFPPYRMARGLPTWIDEFITSRDNGSSTRDARHMRSRTIQNV